MNTKYLIFTALAALAGLFAGCETLPPGVEKGTKGTIAYDILVEASDPGARVEANGEFVGNTPVHLKVFGERDGTFHSFGDPQYVVQALPIATNQYAQAHSYATGKGFSTADPVPQRIYFDMNQKPAPPPPVVVRRPGYYVYPHPYYYGPYPYPYPYPYYYPYWGGPRIVVAPGYWHWRYHW